ncbi:MAG: FadD3 family acyl-CoA ligase [Actinomycetota bacterium]|nr:FadD3 family acyl-CoA ligase [Actinomycetota bacterium]
MSVDKQFGTIGTMIQHQSRRHAHKTALAFRGNEWSYAELETSVRSIGKAALSIGLRRDDRFVIWAPNSPRWIFGALGCVGIGGVMVPINTRFKTLEAIDILERVRPRVLFITRDFLDRDYLAELRATDPTVTDGIHVVVIDGDADPGDLSWDAFLASGSTISDREYEEAIAAVEPDTISDIFFTSGTTGRPKGVMTSHSQNIRVFDVWAECVGLIESDRYLIVNPLFHTFGYKAGVLSSILRGVTMVPLPTFDVDEVMGLIESERITILPGAPTIYLTILAFERRSDFDLSSLRVAVTGAATIPVEMIRRMAAELSFENIVTAYGLSESTGMVSICRPGDPYELVANTSGCAIPDVEVKIVDEEGRELPSGEPGEILCRGYNVMVGYYEDDFATREVIDTDGWLHTGDIGIMDEQGYLKITDRKKDMFIVGGFNAYPAEIENLMLRHPKIAQAAVIGVPDERMGEVGCAFVVPRIDAVTADEVIAWCRDNMANYKAPRYVEVVASLPLNAAGKVLKPVLRELFEAGNSGG